MVPSKWRVYLLITRDEAVVYEGTNTYTPDGNVEHNAKADTLHVRRNMPRLFGQSIQAMTEALVEADDDPFAGNADFDVAPF